MKLSSDQLHVRWFKFWAYQWETSMRTNVSTDRTDLCTYVRVSVLYPILIIAAWTVFGVMLSGVLVVVPIELFGIFGYAAAMATIAAFVGGFLLFDHYRETPAVAEFREGRGECIQKKVGVLRMGWQWIMDRHDRLCTMIEIEGKDDKN